MRKRERDKRKRKWEREKKVGGTKEREKKGGSEAKERENKLYKFYKIQEKIKNTSTCIL